MEAGDLTGPYGARTVLANPDVDVAVLETARGGMMLRGVGYESNDASVLTNVSSDHMDLHGIHTLPELAEVKSVICRITRPDGRGGAQRRRRPGRGGGAPRPRAGLAVLAARRGRRGSGATWRAGGTAFVLDDGELVELRPDGTRGRSSRSRDVPATLGGLARHNIANALAAAAGARAMGATAGAGRRRACGPSRRPPSRHPAA